MNYPLKLSFKLFALANQIYVRDANQTLVCYVKQKMFKLKEAINIFADEAQTKLLFTINADRVIDFSGRYAFADASGAPLGSVRRQGMKSLWRLRYDIMDGETVVMTVQEESAWTKVFDAVLGEIPILGMFTGYFFNPAYTIARANGAPVMRLSKQKSFLESSFKLDCIGQLTPDEEMRVVLSVLMIVLLERARG